jgi:glycine/D-amino acid oxidase-like deaminating enzyme
MIETVDHVVIGGGAYGLHVATSLAETYPDRSTVLLEQAPEPGARASTNNHGRLHRGYMYAENDDTALECRDNADRFAADFAGAIDPHIRSYYGLHRDSAITPNVYEAFCQRVNLPYERTSDVPEGLFGPDVTGVFEVQELSFSTAAVRDILVDRAVYGGVQLRTDWSVASVTPDASTHLRVAGQQQEPLRAGEVFNCAYAGINTIHQRSNIPLLPSAYTEFALFKTTLPPEFQNVSAAVMCGPYVNMVANRDASYHVMAHVTRSANRQQPAFTPGKQFTHAELLDRYAEITADAQTYLPALAEGTFSGYMTEVKSYIGDTHADRTIFAKANWAGLKGYNVIVGGKVSSMYNAGRFAVVKAGGLEPAQADSPAQSIIAG